MSLFKRWFGGKSEAAVPDRSPEQAFDAAWTRELRRFERVTGVEPLDLTIRDPHSRQELPPHLGVAETFTQWRELSSDGQRRLLLFDRFFSIVHDSLNSWQTANYAVAKCRADQALALLERCQPPDPAQQDYADHCAAFARALLSLTRHEEGVGWARLAAGAAPLDGVHQTLLADALHLGGDSDAAHAIYSARLATVPPSPAEDDAAVEEMFRLVFSRETGVLPSPVLAVAIGGSLANATQAEAFWPCAETEFYDSPYFRERYADRLMDEGRKQQSFEKLLVLVEEMPWLREASLRLLRLFEQSDPRSEYLLPSVRAELEERIRRNGWITD
jgi:hypothetical protein